MPLTRRDLSMLLPALAAAIPASAAGEKLPSTVFKYEDLAVKQNGPNKGRAVLDTTTHGGFPVELHITQLAPGMAPHAPHSHVHEEILMLKNGILEATFAGKTTRLTPGSVIFVESNMEHGWRNPGTEPAEYFVIALGNAKK
jgi:quercetin dioxygenase-like cupin family protein